ncbi:hypothetical protein SAMN05444481_101195 [Flavobacterium frigidimaris]|nr:hypothetical protein SAMN05444481_101195 [Flavobacterium frigidimaris]
MTPELFVQVSFLYYLTVIYKAKSLIIAYFYA